MLKLKKLFLFSDPSTLCYTWLHEGPKYRELKKYAEAIACFDEVLKVYPEHPLAWYEKGLTLSDSGKDTEAIKCYTQALKFDPEYIQAWNKKISLLTKLGEYTEVINCYDSLLEIEPKSSTWHNKGKTLIILGKGEEAIKCFDNALELDETFQPAWLDKAFLLEKLGRDVAVIKCYDQALTINPKFKEAWSYKGCILSDQGKDLDALNCYDQALKIDANYPNAWNGKGYVLLYQKQFDKAETYFDKALSKDPHFSYSLQGKGLIAYYKKKFELANEYFQKAEAHVSPAHKIHELCRLYFRRGKAFIVFNNLEKAKEAFEKAVGLNPNYFPAQKELRNIAHQESTKTLTHQPNYIPAQQELAKEESALSDSDSDDNSNVNSTLVKRALKQLPSLNLEFEKNPTTYHALQINTKQNLELSDSDSDSDEFSDLDDNPDTNCVLLAPQTLKKTQPNNQPSEKNLAIESIKFKQPAQLQETPDESQQRLKNELQALNQQLQNNIQYQEKLKQQIQSMQSQTFAAKPSELSNLKKELTDLKMQQAEVQAEYEIKVARRAAEKKFKAQPNLWLFYRIMYIHLENRFLGAKDIESGFPKLGFTGKVGNVATGINIFSKLLSLIPAIGNSLDTIVSVGTTGLEKIDEERITNILKAIAELGTLRDIKRAAESAARQLTERYSDQLNQLSTESKKSTSAWEKFKESGKSFYETTKEFIVKEQASSSPKEVAEFAISQIVSALLDLSIKPDQPLDAQFILAVCAPPSRLEKIKYAVTGILGLNEIETKDGKTWQLQDFYRKPGIRTAEGECYTGEGAEPELFGYRLGTREEAESLQWQLVTTAKEVKQPELVKETPQVPTKTPNSYAAVNAELQEQPGLPVAHKYEVEELKQQLKAAKEAHIKHADELRLLKESQEFQNARREAELRALHSKMSKLLQVQGDTDVSSDVDWGNQLQVKIQSQQASQRSATTGQASVETSVKVVEHDQRLSRLEQLTALWMETEEKTVITKNKKEDSTRTELFSQSMGKR